MADNSIKILIEAQNKATKELNQVKKELEGLKKATKDTGTEGGKSVGGLLDQFKALKMGAVPYLAAAGAAVVAFKKVMDFSREGATLEFTGEKFERLAETIGSTKDAMLRDLREVSKGTVSDMELMASATDFMALGLAKSHDEVVRLTNVASALGMNMNQLVLTLTNQTTMRFDALGVSVDGFKEKVKALEDAGMSASDAFKEAFLQQAEEQMKKVGNAADAAIGSFKRLEAAQKNYFDSLKLSMANSFSGWNKYWAEFFTIAESKYRWENLTKQAKYLGIGFDDLTESIKISATSAAGTVYNYEELAKAIIYLQARLDWAENMGPRGRAGVRDLTNDTEDLTAATWELSTAQQQVVDDFNEFTVEFEKITSLSTNFNGIVNYAIKYDDILKELTVKQNELNQYLAIMGTGGYVDGLWVSADEAKTKVGELTGAVAELQTAMTNMANQVVLDMFAATIAIGGVEQAELEAYMNLAIEMGVMSDEAATAAIEAYSRAVTYIETHKIPDMSFNIIGNLIMPDIVMGGGGGGGVGKNPNMTASGGVVHAAAGAFGKQAYYVGEIGPETFFPAQDGRILSNSETKAAIRSGMGRVGGTINVTINTPMNFADRLWVENELAPYIRDAIQKQAIRG